MAVTIKMFVQHTEILIKLHTLQIYDINNYDYFLFKSQMKCWKNEKGIFTNYEFFLLAFRIIGLMVRILPALRTIKSYFLVGNSSEIKKKYYCIVTSGIASIV